MLSALATVPLTATSTPGATSLSSVAPPPGAATITPEQFGAVGDGIADDAPAIQRALDAAARRPAGATVTLAPKTAYRCGGGLVLDASRVSLWGQALLDFSGWKGRYLRVVASSTSRPGTPANNYGAKGMISGAIRLKGAGADGNSIGIDFDSPTIGTSAQLLVENMAVSGCGTGIRFGDRAYNNLLLRCEVFDCGVCIDYPEADDNGERNTLVGCALYNSRLAVRLALPSAALHLQGCSLDYTGRLYDVTGGFVLATSCHHESSVWEDRAIRCAGDGALIRLDGGVILNQANRWNARSLIEVGRGSTVHLIGMAAHNLALAPVDPTRPAAWATGDGTILADDTQGYDFGTIPPRLHTTRTRLSDPDFRSPAWEDMVWRTRDTAMPVVGRYGGAGDNLQLSKTVLAGENGLLAAKAYGSTSDAAFVLIAQPVSLGEAVLAGFRVRRDPRRPGGDGTLFVSPTWVRLDGQDEHRLPVMVRTQAVGTLTLTPPTDRFVPIAPLSSRTGRTAPSWVTHFCMVINLVKAHQASFLFNGLWCDLI